MILTHRVRVTEIVSRFAKTIRVALEVLYGSLSSLHESFELTYSCYERGNVAGLLFRCSGNSSKGRVSELQAGSKVSIITWGREAGNSKPY